MSSTPTSWRDRIVVDGTDHGAWLAAREPGLGASDVKAFAKLESVDKYVLSLLKPKSFFGNELTKSGHRWEPMILAYLGVPQNLALVHAPDEPLMFCTADGIDDRDPFTLAECKTRHGVIKPNPDAGEWRQLAFQFHCFPEAERILFGTVTVLRGKDGEWEARPEGYSRLEVARDHPRIVAAAETMLPIARQVLAAYTSAREAMKEVPF